MAKATHRDTPRKACQTVMFDSGNEHRMGTPASHAKVESVTIDEVRSKAQDMGLLLDGIAEKADMIRTIQVAEGYQPCFGTQKVADCGQTGCCWRGDCQSHAE